MQRANEYEIWERKSGTGRSDEAKATRRSVDPVSSSIAGSPTRRFRDREQGLIESSRRSRGRFHPVVVFLYGRSVSISRDPFFHLTRQQGPRVMDAVPFQSDPRRRYSPAMSQVDPRRRVPICNATATVCHSPWQIRPLLVFFERFYRADVVLCSFCVAGP